jgi:hypothetical protein
MKGTGFSPYVSLTHPPKPLRVHRLAGLNRGELKMDVIVETLNKVGFD